MVSLWQLSKCRSHHHPTPLCSLDTGLQVNLQPPSQLWFLVLCHLCPLSFQPGHARHLCPWREKSLLLTYFHAFIHKLPSGRWCYWLVLVRHSQRDKSSIPMIKVPPQLKYWSSLRSNAYRGHWEQWQWATETIGFCERRTWKFHLLSLPAFSLSHLRVVANSFLFSIWEKKYPQST